MEKHRAIPEGYMTIGELAKRMNTTVRTLQYYDKEGLFSPSAESDGGRRLYSDEDIVKLHQIQSLKYLGFTLDDIKSKMLPLNTPEQVCLLLSQQEATVKAELQRLTDALDAIKKLQIEIHQINEVDFHKYAIIIELLRKKQDNYWAVKYFSDDTLKYSQGNFTEESAAAAVNKWKAICDEIISLKEHGATPESEKAQQTVTGFWAFVMEFTGGDSSRLEEAMKVQDDIQNWPPEFSEKWSAANDFLSQALQHYFSKNNIDIPDVNG